MPIRIKKYSIWEQLIRGAPLAVMLGAALYIIYRLVPVLELLSVAVLLAVVLRTLLLWLEIVVKVRWLAVLVLVTLMAGVGAFLLLVVVPNLVEETQLLLTTLPNYINSLITLSQKLHRQTSFFPDLSQGLSQLRGFFNQAVGIFPSLLRETFTVSIEAIATLILALYIAYDPASMVAGFLRLIPRSQHQRTNRILASAEVKLRGWIFGTVIAMLIIGVGAALGLWILGIPLFLSFGFIAGFLEVIPYFGSIMGTALPAIVALTISPIKALFVLGLFLILNQVDAHIVQPLVMSRQVSLHPVMVILAFLVMGELLGIIGLLVAVPAAAVLVTILDEFTSKEPFEKPAPAAEPPPLDENPV